jgi:hypothetical protein
MKQLKVTLTGQVTHWASRSFVIEVPDDVNVETLDQGVLESLADDAKVGWDFDAEGFVQTTDHSVEEVTSEADLPVIPFPDTTDDAGRLGSPSAMPELGRSGRLHFVDDQSQNGNTKAK